MSLITKPSVADINRRNQEFWAAQHSLLLQRIAQPDLYKRAMDTLSSEQIREVPIRSRKSLEQALEDADKGRSEIRSEFGRKGGKCPKQDALQKIICGLVARNPAIGQTELLRALKKQEKHGTITKIDSRSDELAGRRYIYFIDAHERKKRVPISGLKDRLSRAKKNSR